MSGHRDLQILTQLYRGWYLNRQELERAQQLVRGLNRELESRVIGPQDVTGEEEPARVR
jgi:hypothetical protein